MFLHFQKLSERRTTGNLNGWRIWRKCRRHLKVKYQHCQAPLSKSAIIIHLLRIAMIRVVKIFVSSIDYKITNKYLLFDKTKLTLAVMLDIFKCLKTLNKPMLTLVLQHNFSCLRIAIICDRTQERKVSDWRQGQVQTDFQR